MMDLDSTTTKEIRGLRSDRSGSPDEEFLTTTLTTGVQSEGVGVEEGGGGGHWAKIQRFTWKCYSLSLLSIRQRSRLSYRNIP